MQSSRTRFGIPLIGKEMLKQVQHDSHMLRYRTPQQSGLIRYFLSAEISVTPGDDIVPVYFLAGTCLFRKFDKPVFHLSSRRFRSLFNSVLTLLKSATAALKLATAALKPSISSLVR